MICIKIAEYSGAEKPPLPRKKYSRINIADVGYKMIKNNNCTKTLTKTEP